MRGWDGACSWGWGGGQSLKPSQQDGAEQVQVRNLTFTSTNETGTWDILAWDDTTVQDQRQIWGVYVFFLTAANGGPCSPGWMLVAKEKKYSSSFKEWSVIYKPTETAQSANYVPFKTTEMVPLAQYSGFSPPHHFFFSFFSHTQRQFLQTVKCIQLFCLVTRAWR